MTLVGSAELASLAERALSGETVDDRDIAAELAPCFVGDPTDASARTDTIVLACTHYPLLLDRLIRLAPWQVELDRSGAGDRAARLRSARAVDRRSRSFRRRNDLHLEQAAHAERRADAVFRRPRAGLTMLGSFCMSAPPAPLNRLRKEWREGRPTFGAIATIPSIQTVRIMAQSARLDHRRPRARPDRPRTSRMP